VNDEDPRRIGGWFKAESIANTVGYQSATATGVALHCRAIRPAYEICAGHISTGRAALNPNVSTRCVGSEVP
jgi:hypothetical protein